MKQLILVATALTIFLASFNEARALNPNSPEVREIVDRAVAFLKSGKGQGEFLGGHAIRGMAILKATHDKKDADVLKEVAYVARAASLPKNRLKALETSQYSLGIALMFLASYDPVQYKPQIQNLLDCLVANQRADGAWSYNPGAAGASSHSSGDTSQTQYGAMATWVALKTAKLQVDPKVFEKALAWLLKKQNSDGSFSYQPDNPEEFRSTISLTAAGSASSLICADALGLLRKDGAKNRIKGLTLVTPKNPGGGGAPSTSIAKASVMTSVGRATNYFNAKFSWKKGYYFYYFMYAMERYMTFKEIAAGTEDSTVEPAWYDQGVEVLQKAQAKDGSFKGEFSDAIATSFAILFLVRSTKATLDATIEGNLRGGYGLPKDASLLREGEDGEVIGTDIKGTLDDLLALLEQGDDTDYEALLKNLKDVKIEKKDARKRDADMEKLRQRIASPNFGARFVAVKAMAAENSLDVAPGLIFALTDPDQRIAIEARNGLRFIARRFDGFGMPDNPDEAQKKAAQSAWKAWLRSIRPDAKFILQ